jgi:hypothetical protein
MSPASSGTGATAASPSSPSSPSDSTALEPQADRNWASRAAARLTAVFALGRPARGARE